MNNTTLEKVFRTKFEVTGFYGDAILGEIQEKDKEDLFDFFKSAKFSKDTVLKVRSKKVELEVQEITLPKTGTGFFKLKTLEKCPFNINDKIEFLSIQREKTRLDYLEWD